MDETKHAVLLDEFRAATGAMLLQPSLEIIGDANVERAVSAAGEDVDVVWLAAGMLVRPCKNFYARGYGSRRFAGTTS
jgi:hypothetical protein